MLCRPPECRNCPLDGKATGFSRPEGKGTLGVLILLEALGGHEAREGLPLRPNAPAGSVFELALRRCPNPYGGGKLTREQVVLWNCVACQPPDNWLTGAPWEVGAIQHCSVHRNRVYRENRPRVILAMGDTAIRTVTGLAGKAQGSTMLRGYVLHSLPLEAVGSIPVIPTYHPSFIRRGSKKRSEDTGAKTEGGGSGGMHLIGVFRSDILLAVRVAQEGFDPGPKPVYETTPGLDGAKSFLYQVKDNPQLPLAYDIETPRSRSLDEEDLEEAGHHIEQIQFSLATGEGICFPFEGAYVDLAREIMSLPNVKLSWNGRNFDRPRLTAIRFEMGGMEHDLMDMWARMQPDLPRGLQFVASFYGFPYPWKHLADSEPEHYGCCDVDAPQRIFAKLPDQMKARGCWRSYERHVLQFDPILLQMSERGIRVDEDRRLKLKEEVEKKCDEITRDIQALVPDELRNLHPKEGYKKVPKVAVEDQATSVRITRKDKKIDWPARWALREFVLDELGEDLEPKKVKVERWVKVLDFNPGSSDQLVRYLKSKGYKIPRNRQGKETTEKIELQRLGKRTKDPLIGQVLELRKYDKMRSTYVGGWAPGKDGRVHPSFYHEGATGQLSSRRPNAQNFPKHSDLAQRFREMIVPNPGCKLVELDYKSAHALTTGFEAQDPLYMRMARIDMHSFLAAAGLLGLKSAEELIALSDEELKEFFSWHKKSDKLYFGQHSFKYIRNKQAKPAILGYGFGMGYRTLYYNNREAFNSERDAKRVVKTLDGIFPVTAQWRNDVRLKAHQQEFLVSLHGAIRRFHDVYHWDAQRQCTVPGDDSEAAIAFLPANDAHGHLKDAALRLAEGGWLKRYRLINHVHDALLFDCPDGLVEECVVVVGEEMEKPSEVLKNASVPEGLWIEVEASVGEDWAHMEEVERRREEAA